METDGFAEEEEEEEAVVGGADVGAQTELLVHKAAHKHATAFQAGR